MWNKCFLRLHKQEYFIWLLIKVTEKIFVLWVLLFPSLVNLCPTSTFCLYNKWHCMKFLTLAVEKSVSASLTCAQAADLPEPVSAGPWCYSVLQLSGMYYLELCWSLISQANTFSYFLHFFSHQSLRIISCDNLRDLLKHYRSVCSDQALVNIFLNERNMFLFTGDCNSCLITEFRKVWYVVKDVLN